MDAFHGERNRPAREGNSPSQKNKAIASMASDSSKSRPPLTAVPSRGNLLRIEAESPAHRSPVPSDASPGEPFSLPTRIFGP